ncbi:MAG: hypothetical protein AB7Q00_01765 [Phycisphaerales bacterium]|nr:MAG: hypothetical protein IPK69_06375 [Phycisphaerales bacterium]
MADYIPGPDADFQAWVANFVTYANAHLVDLDLNAADMLPITSGQTAFNTAFAAQIAARAAALGATQNKDDRRADLTAAVRPLVRRLQASPDVTDAEKAALGITVAAEPSPIGPPTSAPICVIECGNRLQHTLRFADETTPNRKAKPAGVLGVEIWNKVGDAPPAGEGELRFVAVDTSSPFVVNFNSAEGGKTAFYWLRWVSPTGERGPWGEQSQATIAA